MKALLTLLLFAALSTQAAMIRFSLSPPGSDKAVGMSWMNEVPPPTNSTGTGGAISGGLVFDSSSNILHLAIGYGSAAGFSNLTGAAIAMHIHSPAGPGTNAGVLIPLTAYHFPAANPTNGGIIFGAVPIGTNDVSNLMAGLNYINIHTPQYPGGEIRGQLLPAPNTPPTVSCPSDSTLECGTLAQVTVVVGDPDGDALTVVWTVNGVAVQTNTLPATSPPTLANVLFMTSLGLGTNHVGVTVTDSGGSTASCGTVIKVVDTTPPVITKVAADPKVLWPPNDKWVNVRVFAQVTDTCDATTWKIVSVTSDEPASARNDASKDPDWVITGDHTVKLRAEKNPQGSARTYTITVQAKDVSGNLSDTKTVTVMVPKSQGDKD
ncbi:MAG TPA: CHRD domain-containing protein [Candidatus Acidoferrum sp.]|jgi:hypothetical protein|nr:CHRD domain-containing protein [Candidatus Acidoferrum sp.]